MLNFNAILQVVSQVREYLAPNLFASERFVHNAIRRGSKRVFNRTWPTTRSLWTHGHRYSTYEEASLPPRSNVIYNDVILLIFDLKLTRQRFNVHIASKGY